MARYRVQKGTSLHRNDDGLCLENLYLRLTKSNRLAKKKQHRRLW